MSLRTISITRSLMKAIIVWVLYKLLLLFFFFNVRCRLVIFVVPSGRWTEPSGVGRWLFHGVCFLGNFLLARCFVFLFCGERMTAGHGLLVCASSPQGQRADFSIPIFFMWLCSLQWPVLSRNIMVCSWRDSKLGIIASISVLEVC